MTFMVWKFKRVHEHAPKMFERAEDAMKEMERLTKEKASEDWAFMVVERKESGKEVKR